MLIYGGQLNITTHAGSGSANTLYLRGLCHHIIVKPFSDSTEYDFQIINPAGAVIYQRTDEIGTLSELVTIPMLGIYTINIFNSTTDELFVVQTLCQE